MFIGTKPVVAEGMRMSSSRRRFLAFLGGGTTLGGAGWSRPIAAATAETGPDPRPTVRESESTGESPVGKPQWSDLAIPTPPDATPGGQRTVIDLPAMVPDGPLSVLRDPTLFVQTPEQATTRGFDIGDPMAALSWYDSTLTGFRLVADDRGVAVGRPVVGGGRGFMSDNADPDRISRVRRYRNGDRGILLWARGVGGGMVPGPASLVALAGSWRAVERAEIGHPTWENRGIPRLLTHSVTRVADLDGVSAATAIDTVDPAAGDAAIRAAGQGFEPSTSVSELPVLAPTTGRVFMIQGGGPDAGDQVLLRPSTAPAFLIRLYDVDRAKGIAVGDKLTAGDRVGRWGEDSESAIAVQVATSTGVAVLPPVRVMTDRVFDRYRARGIASRDSLCDPTTAREREPSERWIRLG